MCVVSFTSFFITWMLKTLNSGPHTCTEITLTNSAISPVPPIILYQTIVVSHMAGLKEGKHVEMWKVWEKKAWLCGQLLTLQLICGQSSN